MMRAEADAVVARRSIELRGTRVRPFVSGDERQWDAFVEHCESATFFHRAGWRDIFENVLHHRCHYLLAERGDAICGVLPLVEVRSVLFGRALISLPFCAYGGPAAVDGGADDLLIDAAVELARSLRAAHLELRNREAKRPDWPRQDLYVTFRKPILADAGANLLAIPRKQRAMVRKGIAHGLRSVVHAEPDCFFELYADNVHRHGTPPHSRRFFERIMSSFGGASEALIVNDAGGNAVSGVLSFYFRDEVLPCFAGDTLRARELAANDFKYWDLMQRACERGVRVYDYGRSKRGTGPYAFKKNWGFEPTPLAYEYSLFTRAGVPQNHPLNPKYRAFIAAWRRLPRKTANMLGPHIIRHLG
jgi:FemAB-related protein (PEP-CTERM system-associated)